MQPCKALSEALSLSESMCAAAERGRWDQVDEASLQRDNLLRSALPMRTVEEGAVELLTQLAHYDKQLLVLARNQRQLCESRVLANKKAKKATSAYHGVGAIRSPRQ